MPTRPTLADRRIASAPDRVPDHATARVAALQRLDKSTAHLLDGGIPVPVRPPTPCRHRREASRFVREADHCTPIDRNMRAKLLLLAETIERRTKAQGKKNGALGYTGLLVLRALLLQFANASSGLCCPSYTAIMCATGLCRQAISDAIYRLEQTKLLRVTRRLVRERITRTSPITGLLETFVQTVQGSNLYGFVLPSGRALVPLPYRSTRRSVFPKVQPKSATQRENDHTYPTTDTKRSSLGQLLIKELRFAGGRVDFKIEGRD